MDTSIGYIWQLLYVLSVAVVLLLGVAGLLLVYKRYFENDSLRVSDSGSIKVLSSKSVSNKTKVTAIRYKDSEFLILDNGSSCVIERYEK